MIWRSRHVLLLVFLWMGSVHSKALEEALENRARSLSDSLQDSKVSSSISHLLKSLEPTNKESEKEKPLQIITKHGVITAREGTISRNKSGRKLFYGEQTPGVPAPVVVSSQAIRISGGGNLPNGSTGAKRARSLNLTPSASSSSSSTMDLSIDKSLDNVRTIEGVRVPDDEHDKHYTWRNARVIKNFLVPAGRPANPQKKRQILIQDAQSYVQQQQQQSPSSSSSTQQIYFASPQSASSSTSQLLQGQDLTAALYAAAAQQQQQQQQVQSQTQQVYSYATAPAQQSAQQSTYSYPQQGQGTMYVLQADGKTYLPYTPEQLAAATATASASASPSQAAYTQTADQSQSQNQYQSSQFYSRSGEHDGQNRQSSSEETGTSAQSPQSLYQQQYQQLAALRFQQHLQNEQQKQQQDAVKEYQQQILAKAQAHFIASTVAPSLLQSQSHTQNQPHVSINPYSGSGAASPASLNVSPSPSTLAHKSSLSDIAATAIPTGASIGAQLQEQVSLQTAQYLQVQPPGQGGSPTIYQFAGASPALPQPPSVLQERQSNVAPGAASSNQFVIHPHTYVSGSGGPMFSVPVPIPADQVEQHNEQQSNQNQKHRGEHHGHNNNNNNHGGKKERTSLTDKIRDSLQFNRKTALERVETTFTIPVLATTGFALGLGALAAGWYLSKSNREVGILRRTGKPSGIGPSPSSIPNLSLSGSSKSVTDKDAAIVAHIREKRSNTGEIDQASFFQSIIQHGIEKQQKQYGDESEPVRKGNNNNNNNNNYNNDNYNSNTNSNYNSNSNSAPSQSYSSSYSSSNSNTRVQNNKQSYSKNDGPSKNSRAEHREDILDRHGKGHKASKGISFKRFASVAVPAVILGGSVIVIGALIFGWYISGKNREIAFLEPSAYSRRKRSVDLVNPSSSSSSSSSFLDGWLPRTMTAIHSNPYETEGHPLEKKHVSQSTSTNSRNSHYSQYNNNSPISSISRSNSSSSSSLISSKSISSISSSSSIMIQKHHISKRGVVSEYDMTMLSVMFSMAAFAFGGLLVLSGAWWFTDNSREVAWADKGPFEFGHWPTVYRPELAAHPHHKRSISSNDMTLDSQGESENSGFLHKILGSLELSQSSLLNKLQEQGYSKWQETPCAKRIFCDVMSTQGDDTVMLMEKRMTKFLSMLPDSLSNSLSKTLGDVMKSINKKDCSSYTCGGQWVTTSAIPQPSVPAYSPRR